MLNALGSAPADALAGATPYLRLFGLARGGTLLGEIALAAHREGAAEAPNAARIASARFFARNLATGAGGLEEAVVEGADTVSEAAALLAAG